MSYLLETIRQNSEDGFLPWAAHQRVAAACDCTLREVEKVALQGGILPARYRRNQKTISTAGQQRLFAATVAVIGCGGLGGYLVEELARLGVGHLILADPDSFEEHNLNRQLYSAPELLGQAKVTAAAARVARINPVVRVTPCPVAFPAAAAKLPLERADVIADALDSIPARLALAETCAALRVPLVHGAIAGWYGHVSTIFPGDPTLQTLYAQTASTGGIEASEGNPAFTPAIVASLQVAEICKLILGSGTVLRHRALCINLYNMEFDELTLSPE